MYVYYYRTYEKAVSGGGMEVRPSDATLRERNGRKEGDEATV
jgi:hypothetical protein